jgi:predicted RNA polymerase sigma factor
MSFADITCSTRLERISFAGSVARDEAAAAYERALALAANEVERSFLQRQLREVNRPC